MIATGIFSFLRDQTQRSFGEGTYLFFPTARGGTAYTVIVPCTAGTGRGQAKDMPGLLTMGTDTRVFDVAVAAVPFEPRPGDVLLFGPAVDDPDHPGTLIPDPAIPPVKFLLTGANRASFHSHWRLTAERH